MWRRFFLRFGTIPWPFAGRFRLTVRAANGRMMRVITSEERQLGPLKFMMFFAFVLVGWFLLPARGQKWFLLAACWVFYALQSGGLLVLLLLSTLVSYLAALAMERRALGGGSCGSGSAASSASGCCFSITTCLLPGAVLRVAHLSLPAWTSSLAVPAGLSFFTFSITGYLFDVYREKLPAERNFLHYALFTSFFPAILAGPVGMARTFLPQLRQRQTFDVERLKGARCALVRRV